MAFSLLALLLVEFVASASHVAFSPVVAADIAFSSDTPGGGQQGDEEAPWKETANKCKKGDDCDELPKGDKLYKMVNRSIELCVGECAEQKKVVQDELDKVNAEIAILEEQQRKEAEAAMHKARHEKCAKQAIALTAQVANLTEMMTTADGSAKSNNKAATESQEIIEQQAAMLKEQKDKLEELTAALKARSEMADTTSSIQASLEEVKQQLKGLKTAGTLVKKESVAKDKSGLTEVFMPAVPAPDAVTATPADAFAKGKP